jgi:hypothetical protein
VPEDEDEEVVSPAKKPRVQPMMVCHQPLSNNY